jgi:hypothetical protein
VKSVCEKWTHLIQRRGPVVGFFKSGNESSNLIKFTNFVDLLNGYELLKKGLEYFA